MTYDTKEEPYYGECWTYISEEERPALHDAINSSYRKMLDEMAVAMNKPDHKPPPMDLDRVYLIP